MAEAIVVAGACLVRTGTGDASALENLGYSINGVQYFEDVFQSDVPGDQNGGDEGPPIDIQHFGQIDRVRMELSKWDAAVYAKIAPRTKGGTAGQSTVSVGSLLFANSYSYRLLLTAPNFTRNYLRAIPRPPIQLNTGTKFSRLIIEWECHDLSGVRWNTTTSG